MEDPDEDEVMIGDVQVNEEVEHLTSDVSVTEFDDCQQKEYEGILRELQSQDDFMSFHGVPSSEVTNIEVIKTRWVLKPQGEGVKARFVMKHFNTWKDENTNSSVAQLGFGFGGKTCRIGKVTNNCVSRCFHCVSSCEDERRSLHQVGCRHVACDTRGEHDKPEKKDSTEWTKPCMDTEAHHDTGRTLWQRQ